LVYGGEINLATGHTKLKCQDTSLTPDVHTVLSERELGCLQMQIMFYVNMTILEPEVSSFRNADATSLNTPTASCRIT
jgi:hypothetical protein